jgi:VIT1/CCC1 family predicted Fe2+/Mn2+ transporter
MFSALRARHGGMPGDDESVDSSSSSESSSSPSDESSSSEDEPTGIDGSSYIHEESDDCDDDDDSSERMDGTENGHESSSRDEAKEVRKLIQKESNDVRMWRELVTGMLVIISALVTITTYVFLSKEEVRAFRAGVRDSRKTIVMTVQ